MACMRPNTNNDVLDRFGHSARKHALARTLISLSVLLARRRWRSRVAIVDVTAIPCGVGVAVLDMLRLDWLTGFPKQLGVIARGTPQHAWQRVTHHIPHVSAARADDLNK